MLDAFDGLSDAEAVSEGDPAQPMAEALDGLPHAEGVLEGNAAQLVSSRGPEGMAQALDGLCDAEGAPGGDEGKVEASDGLFDAKKTLGGDAAQLASSRGPEGMALDALFDAEGVPGGDEGKVKALDGFFDGKKTLGGDAAQLASGRDAWWDVTCLPDADADDTWDLACLSDCDDEATPKVGGGIGQSVRGSLRDAPRARRKSRGGSNAQKAALLGKGMRNSRGKRFLVQKVERLDKQLQRQSGQAVRAHNAVASVFNKARLRRGERMLVGGAAQPAKRKQLHWVHPSSWTLQGTLSVAFSCIGRISQDACGETQTRRAVDAIAAVALAYRFRQHGNLETFTLKVRALVASELVF